MDAATARAIERISDVVELITFFIFVVILASWIFVSLWSLDRYSSTRNRLYITVDFWYPSYALVALLVARSWIVYYGLPIKLFGWSFSVGSFQRNSCAIMAEALGDTWNVPCIVESGLGLSTLIREHAGWRTILTHPGFWKVDFAVGTLVLLTGIGAWLAYIRWWECAKCKNPMLNRVAALIVICRMHAWKCDACETAENEKKAPEDVEIASGEGWLGWLCAS